VVESSLFYGRALPQCVRKRGKNIVINRNIQGANATLRQQLRTLHGQLSRAGPSRITESLAGRRSQREKIDKSKNGKFARVIDPEGNKVGFANRLPAREQVRRLLWAPPLNSLPRPSMHLLANSRHADHKNSSKRQRFLSLY
jgi:hypothetical protein